LFKKKDYEAFLDGYKPAVLVESDRDYIKLLNGHPFTTAYERDCYNLDLYFQDERSKQVYIEHAKGVIEDSYHDHYLLGVTLGFPEWSAKWFAESMAAGRGEWLPETKIHKIGVNWAGFGFGTHLDMLIDEVRWLWSVYDHPATRDEQLYLWNPKMKRIAVNVGDFEQLETARQYIMQQRGSTRCIE
jgi:hypothetical protein